MLLIKNAKLYSFEKNCDEVTTDILIEDGVFTKIEANIEAPKDAKIIDAKKNIVTPGLIDPHCHIGIGEEGIGFEGRDYNEVSDPVTPNLRALDAIYVEDTAFKDALRGGVTTVVTGPGSGNAIGGTFTAMKTYGSSLSDMIIEPEVAMKMALGENPKRLYGQQGKKAPYTRMATAALIRDTLEEAYEYHTDLKAFENGEADKKPKFNSKLHSLARVFDGFLVKIHAHRTDDMETAIRIANEFNLNYTIEHATESHLMMETLKQNNTRVIIGPLFGSRSKYELKNKTLKMAGIISKNEIPFAIMTDHPVIPLEETRVQTATLIREGLCEKEALKAMTIYAAKLNEIDDRVGSVEIGKDADLVIWSGNPFEYKTKTITTIVNGQIAYTNN